MATIQELMAQKEAIELQIEAARTHALSDAISKVRALIDEHKLTQKDVFGNGVKAVKSRTKMSKVAAKYHDPISGGSWSGRGLAPKWMKGKDKEQFLIKG